MGCHWIERHLVLAFDGYGRFVCRHPAAFLLIPLIVSLMTAGGLLLMKTEVGVVMLFTPRSAPSRREQIVARDFISVRPLSDDPGQSASDRLPYEADEDYVDLWFNMQVAYEDRRNLMDGESWFELSDRIRYLNENFTCTISIDLKSPPKLLRYNPDFCNPKRGCFQIEDYVRKIADVLNRTKFDSKIKEHIQLSYPIMYVFRKPFNWAPLIYGVKVNSSTNELESARVISLFFQFQYARKDVDRGVDAQICMQQMADYLMKKQDRDKDSLKFYPLTERMMDTEVMRTKTYALPYLALTIGLITAFTVFSSLTPGFVRGSAFESLMGVCTIGLSLSTSFGFLFICGRYFNAIVIIAPFLVMCVGIDNDFLIMAAYRQTDKMLGAEIRLGRAFSAAGPSLTITSITDILCFGIGFLSDTPSVANFCLYTSVSLTFRYVYQLTFFASIMAYVGRLEERNTIRSIKTEKSIKSIKLQESMKSSGKSIISIVKSIFRENENGDQDHVAHKFFRDYYAPFLMLKSIRVVSMILYLVYLIVILYYASRMKVNISPHKLVVDDSPLIEYFNLAEHYSWSDAVLAHVFVTEAPDFRNRSEIDIFDKFVKKLSNITEFIDNTTNPSDTNGLWLNDYMPYLDYVAHLNDDFNEDFYDYMPDFLSSPEYQKYWMDLRFKPKRKNETRLILAKFRFTAFYRGLSTWEKHVRLMQYWRRVCLEYDRYQAVVYDHHHLNIYLDQRMTLEPTTLQTSGIAILSMAFITAVFMPDLASVFYICLSFLSVDMGVIGFLSMWGTDLDPITMVCVLMTIGFSVYYTARICYCYRTLNSEWAPDKKIAITLGAVGWPITQGGLATVLGILPLGLVHSHMVRVFFKTIILMVMIGLMHGLIVMPIMMCAFDQWRPPRRRGVRVMIRNESGNEKQYLENGKPDSENGHIKQERKNEESGEDNFEQDKDLNVSRIIV